MRVKVSAVGGATSLADRKHRAGQRLMVGFLTPHVTADLRALLSEVRPMGIVLFARNLAEPEQAKDLCRELSSLADPHHPLLIALDCEGGRVVRMPEPAVRWPSARTLGRASDGEDTSLTESVWTAMGEELASVGIHLALGPVADVDSSPASGIGDRSFGASQAAVGRHVASALSGLRKSGVSGCVKHFPGLGAAPADAHQALPVIERDIPELTEVDLAPFAAAIAARCEAVMVGHAVYPAWDEDLPATLSSRLVPGVLRRRLGFQGLVISDDLEMKALARFPIEERARGADRASIDVLMSCDDPEAQYGLFRALVLAQEEEAQVERSSIDAERRVQLFRERLLLAERPPVPLSRLGHPDHRILAATVRARGG